MAKVPVRHVARVVVLDAKNSVLLVRYRNHREGPLFHYWAAPGGAVETGETYEEAAARELKEESGLDADIERQLWMGKFHWQAPQGWVEQIEQFFLVRVSEEAPSVQNTSREAILEHRWWSLRALAMTSEVVYPEGLRARISQLEETGVWAEECEIVNAAGESIGRAVGRGARVAAGEFFLVIHLWIRDEAGAYLVQQRALDLESDPGIWATTVGYVHQGEDSRSAAIREADEELGVHLLPNQLTRFGRAAVEDRFEDRWLASVSRERLETARTSREVNDWKWATKDELRQMIEEGCFFPYSYFEKLPE